MQTVPIAPAPMFAFERRMPLPRVLGH